MNVQDNRMINSPHGKYSGNFYIPEGVEYVKIRYWSPKA